MKTKQLQQQLCEFVDTHDTFYAYEMPERLRNTWLTQEPLDIYLSRDFEELFEYQLFYNVYLKYCLTKDLEPENKNNGSVIRLFQYFQQFLVFRNRFEDDLNLFDFERYEEMRSYIFQVYLFLPRQRPSKSKESGIHILVIFILSMIILIFILLCL